ncbi:surfeit locus protein 6 homolog [Pistacia vera]|uniref:surfeit locus protein 6 homolog n=1 Tax=Pistacia vera TaxID=55513 RepID=UPI0012633052|nr:surfeit locus protein 6 homolog [Pistacia vera]XP_031264908.1 surfeit locus protein 6 homolog [Pistacia vera]
MGKEKQTLFNKASSNGDLKSIIQQHTLFFDKLIELIPAKFYVPSDDKKQWFQGLSKNEKALAKKESRENIKKARRERFDPNSNKTTLDLLKQNLEKEKSNEDSDDEEIEVKPVMLGLESDERSVTYEELRQRLRRKIEELQAGRNAGSSDQLKKKSEKKGIQQKKRKRESGSEGQKSATIDASKRVEEDIVEASKGLAFSHVKIGNEEKHGKKKRKLSKFMELEKAQKIEEAKKDPEKGEMIAKKLSWNAATSRAAGIKIHDNPKLLKQSLQKKKKKQQKNSEKWNERIETTQKMKAERQQKRSENLADRSHQKKMRRIEKREKKLMRPGFEGRKEGYINQGAS